MIQDLHSHTYYSFCGRDRPEAVIETAAAGGIERLGITDHNYGVGYGSAAVFYSGLPIPHTYAGALDRYYDHMALVRERYDGRIRILLGLEVCTLGGPSYPNHPLPEDADVSRFDFLLLEHIDKPESIVTDLFSYAASLRCPVTGLAHTDLFAYMKKIGADPYDYLSRMAEAGIFGEMNVNYDSIHGYHVHEYVTDFFENEEQQDLVRRAGTLVSVGFDGHRAEDYLPERVKDYNDRLDKLGIKKPFDV